MNMYFNHCSKDNVIRSFNNFRGRCNMKFKFILLIICALVITGCSKNSEKIETSSIKVESPYKFKAPTGYSTELEPYVNFLKSTPQVDPVDYVMNLFEKYDIVVLCERNHQDITQYELIYDIVRDERFIEKVGCVFTEIGTQTINDRLNAFLQTKGLTQKEVDNKLVDIYRNLDRCGYWEKYNLYDFLKKILYLNNSLSKGKQIKVNCSDMPVDWESITVERYKQEIIDKEQFRDEMMAEFIIKKYKEFENSETQRKKALVIMNTRHGFKEDMGTHANTTAYLNKILPGKVANIMINSIKELPGTTDKTSIYTPIQSGKWDATFRYTKNINRAFDFKGSPFGEDRFDYYDTEPHKDYKYQDIFNGFIFYYPIEEHLLVLNVPGVFDSEFLTTCFKRLKMRDPNIPDITSISTEQINQEIKDKNTMTKEFYPDMMKYNAEIEKWLKY